MPFVEFQSQDQTIFHSPEPSRELTFREEIAQVPKDLENPAFATFYGNSPTRNILMLQTKSEFDGE